MISIVIPVYNSSKSLELLFNETHKVFALLKKDFEVIFVEDHSKDESWATLCKLKALYPEKIKAVKLSKNFGQHNAIMCGLHFAGGNTIITMDDDLQTHPQEIPRLIQEQERTKAELVYGSYAARKHSYASNIINSVLQRLFRMIFKNEHKISSFRLFSKGLAEKIKQHTQSFVFLDGLLLSHAQQVSYASVEHKERVYGSSNYTAAKLVLLGSNLILNKLALRINKPQFLVEKS